MGFDQYHEPPDELPPATRTFARLCASLTEEAEAIGWYEQRLAIEPDREAREIMRDAQGEEFKHFAMDLEFLLRRTPLWREIAQGILFQEGDIVEHGEEAEEEAVEGAAARGAPLAGGTSLGIGGLRGAPFALARSELRDADRGAGDVDLDALGAAAHRIAIAENRAVFHGWEAAGITGIAQASTHDAITLGEDCERYPRHVARAVDAMLCAGVGGPYGLALGPEIHTRVLETTEHGGYPLLDHLRKIVGGPLVWAPGVEGAVVVSQRGGDFLFEAGEDLSIGYESHDAQSVDLYLLESFTFRVATAEAAVALSP